MGRVIAVANQKGGVGKTTTVINLSAYLAEKNKSVLVIDSDPQGNTTTGLGLEKNNGDKTFYDLLTGNADFFEIKKRVEYFNAMDILPTDINLAGAEIELLELDKPNFILKNTIDTLFLRDRYDFIVIDCPPSLNILTLNALVAANSVLVPLQCEFLALEGLTQFIHTYNIVKNKLNNKIELEGIIFTMFDGRTNLSLQVVEEVKNYFDDSVYKCIIPRNIRLSEAPSHGMPINLYDPKSKGAEAYKLLADMVIEHGK